MGAVHPSVLPPMPPLVSAPSAGSGFNAELTTRRRHSVRRRILRDLTPVPSLHPRRVLFFRSRTRQNRIVITLLMQLMRTIHRRRCVKMTQISDQLRVRELK